MHVATAARNSTVGKYQPLDVTVVRLASRYDSLSWAMLARLWLSRRYAWMTRMPLRSSCSAAVTSARRERICPYAFADWPRKTNVSTAISGNTTIVASARRKSRNSRMPPAITRVSTLRTVEVRPSVTSCWSASTSLVRREIRTPVRCFSK